MQTGRSTTSQLKRHPAASSGKASSKPVSLKVYSLIDSLHLQLTSSPPLHEELSYFRGKIEEYRMKLMKSQPLKKTKRYHEKLEECQVILETPRNPIIPSSKGTSLALSFPSLPSPLQHTRTQSGEDNSKYNSVQIDLLRSTVQSKEGLLKLLYEKERTKVKSFEQVIKQQQREIELVQDRLQEVQMMRREESLNRNKGKQSKQSSICNKQNIDSNMSGTSKNSNIFEKADRSSKQNSKTSREHRLVELDPGLVRHREQLMINLQNQNRMLLTTKHSLQLTVQNKDRAIRSKQAQISQSNSEVQQLKEQLRVKEEILTELMYQKENYSDAYLKLKEESQDLKQKLQESQERVERYQWEQERQEESQQEKVEERSVVEQEELEIKQEQLMELEDMVARMRRQLDEEKERNMGLIMALQKQEEKMRKLTAKCHDSEEESKQAKLKLRTMEHKMEMYMEKYYKLQNECIMEDRHRNSKREMRDTRSFDRSEKLYTAETYEISCDREMEATRGRDRSVYRETGRQRDGERYINRQGETDREARDVRESKQRETNRKRQVLSEIKNMVRDRRNHLFQ